MKDHHAEQQSAFSARRTLIVFAMSADGNGDADVGVSGTYVVGQRD